MANIAKVLLIDNDRDSRQILTRALKLYNYDVVTTQRGDEGITLAATEAPDLIVMDIDAVGLNGWQAIKILRESSPTGLIPVIAMADPSVNGHLLIQTGFDAYLKKPASVRHILERIETLLDKSATNLAGTSRRSSSLLNLQTTLPEAETTPYSQSLLGETMVVCVDDNSLSSQVMAEIVEGAGYSYVNISDSLQVLSQLIKLKPQLIFLELGLPVANGYELCTQIRRISMLKNTPIVIVANTNRISAWIRAKMVGASDFVSKPIKAKSVLKLLLKYLSPFTMA